MPTYEYECPGGHRYEKREGFDAPAKQRCAQCRRTARRILHAPSVVFKGSGFYITDSRKAAASKAEGAAASKAEGAAAATDSESKGESATAASDSESKVESTTAADAKPSKPAPAAKDAKKDAEPAAAS